MTKAVQTWNASATAAQLSRSFRETRRISEAICQPLAAEDCVVQSMPDVSPARWHLAHTTWFFETFILRAALADYESFDPAYEVLFNSYYNSVGEQFPRDRRGLLSRPTVAEVLEYRRAVDERLLAWLAAVDEPDLARFRDVLVLGLNHEQQHQELMLTDIKHVLSCNPLFPTYFEADSPLSAAPEALRWYAFDEGLYEIGHAEPDAFAYDNELPRHKSFVADFELSDRLITCGEYLRFIEDGGYAQPRWWLAAGWSTVREQDWRAPLYWQLRDDRWCHFTLGGLRPVDWNEPVCHVSFYEADAYARWADARLATEVEWEIAAESVDVTGQFFDASLGADGRLSQHQTIHPRGLDAAGDETTLRQMFGSLWQWTGSQYLGYPGYQAAADAIGEYNGKFMSNQFVLRGGSVATSANHMRRSYRNFFPPEARWQFSGIRLAR